MPWVSTLAAGVAVLLAGSPVSTIIQGGAWAGRAVIVVAVVAVVGLLLHRTAPVVVAAGQVAAVLVVLTGISTDQAILGLIPGPDALRELGELMAGAGAQIDTGVAPVPATPEILLLVGVSYGLLAVAVHLAAVSVRAPAAAGVPLLAAFAVPAALADELLPWWTMAAAGLGFGLLLIARDDERRQLPGGVAVVAGAVVLALGVGAIGFVGTAGRFEGGTGSGNSGGSIGLSPFTSLRGQLDLNAPEELFRVRGLPDATYLRALTLRDYVPDTGWQASSPEPGTPLPGPLESAAAATGRTADIAIENVAFRDYWLPLYGTPLDVSDLSEEQWAYDSRSGTAYAQRPRQEDGWVQRALLPEPTVEQLRSAGIAEEPAYLVVDGVDPRVTELAAQVVLGRTTAFDRALALQDYFTGPDSTFTYSLQTAPGTGDDALVEFLTVGRIGYCEQYASAMAVMLRTVGVPARVAVGFTGGTDNGDYRSISTTDAHAWVEAWFEGAGWVTFDPTPLTDGRAITPPYVREARAEATGEGGSLPEDERSNPQREGLTPTPAPIAPLEATPEAAAPRDTAADGFPLWPVGVVLLLAVAALVPLGLRERARRRRMAAVAAGGPDAAGAAWDELLAESADRGGEVKDGESVRATARRLVHDHRLDGDSQQALRQVVGAVEASWYGDAPVEPGVVAEPLRRVRSAIAAGSALSVRNRLLPRSVLRKPGRLRPRARNGAR